MAPSKYGSDVNTRTWSKFLKLSQKIYVTNVYMISEINHNVYFFFFVEYKY